jgi:hypothetical protein
LLLLLGIAPLYLVHQLELRRELYVFLTTSIMSHLVDQPAAQVACTVTTLVKEFAVVLRMEVFLFLVLPPPEKFCLHKVLVILDPPHLPKFLLPALQARLPRAHWHLRLPLSGAFLLAILARLLELSSDHLR